MGKIFTGWEAEPANLIVTPDETEPLKATFVMPSVNVIVRGKFENDTPPYTPTPDNPHGYVYEDIGGKVYPTVKIGNQVWMAENLDYNVSGSVYYNNASGPPFEKAGKLYRWEGAVAAATEIDGWHLPSWEEWLALTNSTDSGRHLKATSGWAVSNYNGWDTYGFTALPAGWGRPGGEDYTKPDEIAFRHIGQFAYWWGANETGDMGAYVCYIDSTTKVAHLDASGKLNVSSVRLVKDS
jgi:uncharacterized protein (TIGR02145 family)